MTSQDRWRLFADVCERTREAFPESAGHLAVARRWVMREPKESWHECAACGQRTPDALSLPKRHEVDRIVGATSDWETTSLQEIGPSPGFGSAALLQEWTSRRREIDTAELHDLAFRVADWSLPPQRLAEIRKRMGLRWICCGCALAAACVVQPAHPSLTSDRVFADLRRAVGEGPLADALESWRASATPPAFAARPCGFCRRVMEGFVLPWFRLCRSCAVAAAEAPSVL